MLGQDSSCSSALLPVELSENMLQNLLLNLPPQTVSPLILLCAVDEVAALVDERALLYADVLDGGRVGRLLQSLGGGQVLHLDLRAAWHYYRVTVRLIASFC